MLWSLYKGVQSERWFNSLFVPIFVDLQHFFSFFFNFTCNFFIGCISFVVIQFICNAVFKRDVKQEEMFAALSDNRNGIPMRTIKVCCMHAVWQWRRNNLSEINVQLWRTIDTNSQLHSYICGKLLFYSCVHLCKSASHEWSSLDFKASCSFMYNVFPKLGIFRKNFGSARSSAMFVTFNYGARLLRSHWGF